MKRWICRGICLAMLLGGCGSAQRRPVTPEEFQARGEAAGYQVVDCTDQFPQEGVQSVLAARCDGYHIEFYQFAGKEEALLSFESTLKALEDGREDSVSQTQTAFANYNLCRLTTADEYYVLTRIECTLLYAAAPLDKREELEQWTEELGY